MVVAHELCVCSRLPPTQGEIMFKRSGLLVLVSVLSMNVFAQESVNQSVNKEDLGSYSDSRTSGVSLNLLYSNLSDSSSRVINTANVGNQAMTSNENLTDTAGVSFYGLGIALEKPLQAQISWNVGLGIYRGPFSTVVGSTNINIYKPEANLLYAVNPMLQIYGGLNTAYLDLSSVDIPGGSTFSEAMKFGGQAGLEMKLHSFVFAAGYQFLRGSTVTKSSNAGAAGGFLSSTNDYQVGGFTTQIGYIF